MDFVPVQSSHLQSVGYNAETQTLVIQFTNATVYEYAGVPPTVYRALVSADSAGKAFYALIRGKYVARKVEISE